MLSVIEVRVRFDEYRSVPRGESNTPNVGSPPLPCAVVFRTWYDQVGVFDGELQASPSKRGLHTALSFDTRCINEVETSLRHHEQRRDTLRLPGRGPRGQAPSVDRGASDGAPPNRAAVAGDVRRGAAADRARPNRAA